MIRNHRFRLAAGIAVALAVGSTLAIVAAQQPIGGAGARSLPGTGTANNFQRQPAPPGSNKASATMSMAGAGMSLGIANDDPEMMELIQAEGALVQESGDIVQRFADSDNAQDRKKITAELRETLAKQFDVQRKRRELELGRIEEQVRKLRDQIKKRDDSRESIIDRRLDQLVNELDGLGWASPVGPAGRGSMTMRASTVGPAGGGTANPGK